jgi:hypothetical protein
MTMNIKKIILFAVILMIAISSLSMVSAGWFDNFVESDTFKFEKPNGFSGSGGDGRIILTNDQNDQHSIMVSEITKDNYTKFLGRDFAAENENNTNNVNNYGITNMGGADVQKDINESNMRIVVLKDYSLGKVMGITHAVIQKDNSYYSVNIKHPYATDLINEDIEIVKNIEKTLEKK